MYEFASERLCEAEQALLANDYQGYVMSMRNLRAAGFYDVEPRNQVQRDMLNMCPLPIDLYANQLVKLWHRRESLKAAAA
ncbi:hypothetical protein [Tardiphaga sp.]|jgi:hypothetical protein|uniref:hypothetical protein n=1 Tax=Tardiphaga sp. TaxID=1926292 RepID=UPI0037DA74E1